MISETVVLRREMHALHEQCDAAQRVAQCVLHAMDALRMDLVEAGARARVLEEQRDE